MAGKNAPRSKKTIAKIKRGSKEAPAVQQTAAPAVENPIPRNNISVEERQRMISEEAYFRAEQRGFINGDPIKDWLTAETEIDQRLAGSA